MDDELRRAKSMLIAECPAAARVILPELNRRVVVVRCGKCIHNDEGTCWKTGRVVRDDSYCDEGEEKIDK